MLLVTYRMKDQLHLAFLIDDLLYNCHEVHRGLPKDEATFLKNWERYHPLAVLMDGAIRRKTIRHELHPVAMNEADSVIAVSYPGLFTK